MYHYSARFQLDRPSGSYTVTFPDFDWGVTQGDDLDDAMFMAHDLLKIFLEDCIEHRKPLPKPSKKGRGYRIVSLPALEEAKVALYAVIHEAGLRNLDLARRLRQPVAQVERLLDLRRRSKMDDIEAAFGVLGKSISIEVRNAA
ncbi:MAG: type II toxin-antitoxin system HicB family antitoxin [Bryobacteraceae bacterium]|jgi:antitoxin HicB